MAPKSVSQKDHKIDRLASKTPMAPRQEQINWDSEYQIVLQKTNDHIQHCITCDFPCRMYHLTQKLAETGLSIQKQGYIASLIAGHIPGSKLLLQTAGACTTAAISCHNAAALGVCHV